VSSCFVCSYSFSVLSPKAIFTPHKCFLLGWMKVKVVNALRTKCHSRKKTQHVSIMVLFRATFCIRMCFHWIYLVFYRKMSDCLYRLVRKEMYLAARQQIQSKRSRQLRCIACVVPPSLCGIINSMLFSIV